MASLPDVSSVDRANITAVVGDANKVVINDADGKISSEQYLARSRGGLAMDVSNLTVQGNDGKYL